MRPLPDHIAIVVVNRRSGPIFQIIIPHTEEDLAGVLILPDRPQGNMRRLPMTRAKPSKRPTVPFLSSTGPEC